MRSVPVTGLLLVVVWCGSASAQPAVFRLQSTNSTLQVRQGETITLEAVLETDMLPSTQQVRGYQAQIEITPGAGATGDLSLADPVCPGSPADPPNSSIFIDKLRGDYLFAPPLPPSSIVVNSVNCPGLVVVSAMTQPGVGPFAEPKYLVTYILKASAHAGGEYHVNFVLDSEFNGTLLRGQIQQAIPFTTQGVTITVIPAAIPTVSGWGLIVLSLTMMTIEKARRVSGRKE